MLSQRQDRPVPYTLIMLMLQRQAHNLSVHNKQRTRLESGVVAPGKSAVCQEARSPLVVQHADMQCNTRCVAHCAKWIGLCEAK